MSSIDFFDTEFDKLVQGMPKGVEVKFYVSFCVSVYSFGMNFLDDS